MAHKEHGNKWKEISKLLDGRLFFSYSELTMQSKTTFTRRYAEVFGA